MGILVVGAKASFVVKAQSAEHKAMVEAMKMAEIGFATCVSSMPKLLVCRFRAMCQR